MRKTKDNDAKYTSPLLKDIPMKLFDNTTDIAPDLPKHWPMWMKPDFDDVCAEMSADPRWADWVKRTQER